MLRCVIAVSLVASMSFVAVPVSAQSAPMDPADLFDVESDEPESSEDTPAPKRIVEFNDEAAQRTYILSFILIAAGGTAGTLLAQNKVKNPYLSIGLPTLASGFAVGSLVSIQAGLETDSFFAGAMAVLLNAALPVIIGATL